ncbi:DUF3311 domain-containing protein [Hansschlegelia beijingensis]|uniref:DUF3311 domain-containing protein n=1 Tax=Hansschlegelia beijingensis TaxID=1133344 RepID=A0A7W6CV73_9HYPH|nr:DUF3311 domain-containing protein [Hansschlegelia beijingensis]MBB3971706.1 hypothetical protein [Hansschlegelia beijingensis]
MDRRKPRAALWLLIIPYVGLLYPAFYNHLEPRLWGFPFFYWYQLAFVPITALLTYVAYRSVRDDD